MRCFNPLPLPKQGEMSSDEPHQESTPGFNPLPLPKQGEISQSSLFLESIVSIRSPYPRGNQFQSAPLTEARGDLRMPSGVPIFKEFQSAPLTEARGDSCPNAVIADASFELFQSAPLTEARGDGHQGYPHLVHRVSIRSPYRSKGRSSFICSADKPFNVSIRSPYRSKGRFQGRFARTGAGFQSAPLTEARGDLGACG